MTHHFFNHFLCLVTLICLFNPTLSAGDCAKCKESLGQSDISNNEIDGTLSEDCPICQDILDRTNVSDPAIELECKHVFHKQCLIQHFDSTGCYIESSCPLCRAVIPKNKFYLPTDESDEAFLAFVKDKLPTEEYQKEILNKEKEEIRKSIRYENSYFYETHLGVLFLLHKNWHNAIVKNDFEKETAQQKNKYEKQKNKFEEQKQKHEELKREIGEINPKYKEKNKKYDEQKKKFEEQTKLEEGHNPKLAQQLPPLQFKFFHNEKEYKKLIDVVNSLSMISDFLFNPLTRTQFQNKFEELFHFWSEPILENEKELMEKYGMKKEEGEGTSKGQQKTEKATKGQNEKEKGTKGQNEKEKGTKDNFIKNINHLFKKEKPSQTEKEKIGKLMGKEAAREKFNKIMEKMSEIAKTLTKKYRRMMQKIIWMSPFLPE